MGKNKKQTTSRLKTAKKLRIAIAEGNREYKKLEKEGKLIHKIIPGK